MKKSAMRNQAVHGRQKIKPDPGYEKDLSAALLAQYGRAGLLEMYDRFSNGLGAFDAMMRRVIWRAVARKFGNGIRIGVGVGFKHLETFEIDDGVFIGDHAYLQGRYDGRFQIGLCSWIGPQAYMDARALRLGRYVGWGPGAKVLGSQHTGEPTDVPIIKTDLICKPVVVEDDADIGTNACLLPGVTIGKGSIVGAGAVVTHDVKPYSIVAGVPAQFLRKRNDRAKR